MEVDEDELVDTLEKQFSLSRNETLAYLNLLRKGDLTAGEVAQLLVLNTSDAGILLEAMKSKGLVIDSTREPKAYAPLHPRMTLTNIFKLYEKDVVQNLRQRRATVDRVVNLLTPLYEERKRKEPR